MIAQRWQLGHGKVIRLDRPRVVAIFNLTPDSFADGGALPTPSAVRGRAERDVRDGAAMIEVGGESTRPGAERVDAGTQIERLIPAIEAIRSAGGPLAEIPIGVDTTRAEVARAAIEAGADAINDVSAGTEDPAMFEFAAQTGAGLVLMHRLDPPERDQFSDQYTHPPAYGDVVEEVRRFLEERLSAATDAGVDQSSIVLDPGLGFGKTVEQNLELVRRTGELLGLGRPVMSAASRKSFVGRVGLDRDSDPGERLAASVALTVLHARAGARLMRVHDVGAHMQALRMLAALSEQASDGDIPGP